MAFNMQRMFNSLRLSRAHTHYAPTSHGTTVPSFVRFRYFSSSASPPIPPSEHELEGGRLLARLSKLCVRMRRMLEHEPAGQCQLPVTVVQLEQSMDEAESIISSTLAKMGKPCTATELADRIKENVVAVPTSALGYREYIRATQLRDDLYESLGKLEIMPPTDTALDGEGKLFCRLQRRENRDRILAGLGPLTNADEDEEKELMNIYKQDDEDDDETENQDDDSNNDDALSMLQKKHFNLFQNQDQVIVDNRFEQPPELAPITKSELLKRKAYLQQVTSMEHVLRGFDTALLQVGRVNKVVKGGTTMRMRALVVIGNRKGTAGYGEGKSETAQHAIERACRDAKRNLLYLDLYKNRTIYHRVRGQFVRSKVSLWPKPKGSGITGNNNYAAIFQLFGIKDVGAKQHGPRTLINSVKALFNGLSKLETPESICKSRGLAQLPRPPPLRRKPNYRPL